MSPNAWQPARKQTENITISHTLLSCLGLCLENVNYQQFLLCVVHVCDAKENLEERMTVQSPGAEKHFSGGLLSVRISPGHFFSTWLVSERGATCNLVH